MTKRRKIIVGVCIGVVGVFLVSVIGFAGVFYFAFADLKNKDQEHLPDEVLIQNFRDHRSEFEQIRSMLERDENIFSIDDDWTDPTDLPAEKVQEYRHLFAILGTPRGFYNRRNPFRIELIASARGWVTSGSMKGYVYLTERPKDTVSDLDRYHNGSGAKVDSALRHIEGNWYLFFDH